MLLAQASLTEQATSFKNFVEVRAWSALKLSQYSRRAQTRVQAAFRQPSRRAASDPALCQLPCKACQLLSGAPQIFRSSLRRAGSLCACLMHIALPQRLCRLHLLPCITQLPLQILCVLHCSLLLLMCGLSLQGQVTTMCRNGNIACCSCMAVPCMLHSSASSKRGGSQLAYDAKDWQLDACTAQLQR